ncbi:hypothetical protein ACLOJK_006321 [Asimina triloba]
MDFRRIESGGSEISNISFLSENAFESEASSCFPATQYSAQVKEASSSSQARAYGNSSRVPATRNVNLQSRLFFPQSMILPPPILQSAAGMQAPSSTAAGGFTPFLLEQINRAVPQPPIPAHPAAVRQNLQCVLNASRKESFRVPHRASYDLNSPASADIPDESIGFSMAPVTPDRGGVESGQIVENVVPAASGMSREKQQHGSPLPRSLPFRIEPVQDSREQSPFPFYSSVNSLPAAMFSKQIAGKRGLSLPLYSSQTVGSTPSMVFQHLASSPMVVTTSSAHQKQGLSQPPEALLSNQCPPEPSGFPFTPVKESCYPLQSVDSSPAVDSVPVQENNHQQKGEDKEMDLNKTPPQKPPRRKKHRPKVIREDKPKKPPKPKTPRPAANKENSTGKRKYVRKTGLKASSMPPSTEERESNNLEDRATKKSCRRSLNFDSPVDAEDQQPNTGMQHDRQNSDLNNAATNDAACGMQNVGMVRSDGSFGLSCSTGSKPTLQLANGLEVCAFDLNCSVNEVLEKYISLPENPSSPIAREHIKENSSSSSGGQIGCKALAICSEHDGKTPVHESVQPSEVNQSSDHLNARALGLNYIRNPTHSCQQDWESSSLSSLQNGIQAVSERQHHSDISGPVQVAGNNHTKTSNAVLCPMNIEEAKRLAHQTVIQGNKDSTSCGYQDIHVVDISRRTNMSRIEFASSASHSMLESSKNINAKMAALGTSDGWPFVSPNVIQEGKRTVENSSGTRLVLSENVVKEQHVQNIFGRYFAHLDREMRNQQGQSGSLEQEPAEKRKKLKSNPSVKSLRHTLPALVIQSQSQSQHHQVQSSHGAARTYDNGRAGNIVHGTLALVENLANTLPKVKTKKRTTKAQARVRDGTPLCAPYQGSMEPRGAQLGQKSTKRNTSLYKDGKPISALINNEQGRSNLQHKPHTGFRLQLCEVIEEIIRGIENLNIDVDNAKKALVPFIGERTMVLYDGQAYQVKKRRPRAKVDLDEETNRVWKLLMWKEGTDGTEGIDAEKGKYWEEQRHIFRGRADSFIARMRLVQGDRQFSPWKGSVVDSVVGVFLTQNVSDHLSSSAFMALAARFPLRSRGENAVPNGDRRSASVQEGVCTAETEETINWHDKPSSPQACNQSPSHGADNIAYRKEVINCNESFGSNVGNSMPNHSKSYSHIFSCISGPENYQESPEDKTNALIAVTESPCFIDVEERKAEDYVISSQTSIVSSQNSTDSTPQVTERIGSTSESNSEADNLMSKFEAKRYAPTSFMGLLAMALSSEHNSNRNGMTLTVENNESTYGQFGGSELDQTSTRFGGVVPPDTFPSIGRVDYLQQQEHHMFEDGFGSGYDGYHLQTQLGMGQMDMPHGRMPSERRLFPSSALEVAERDVYYTQDIVCGVGNEIKSRDQQNMLFGSQKSLTSNFLELLAQNSVHASSISEAEASYVVNPPLNNGLLMERNEFQITHENMNHMVSFNHQMGDACLQSDFIVAPGCKDVAEALPEREISRIQQRTSILGNNLDPLDVESSRSANDKQSLQRKGDELKSKDEGCTSKVLSTEIPKDDPKRKRGRKESDKKKDFDWDSLRRETCCNGQKKERTSNRMDSLDWEAVRLAKVSEVSDTIRERGMNNMLAQRIQDFLNRVVEDHGHIDLEWLRDIPPEKAKEYLLSIRGLGLKSVECVRLLTLHHLAFPVRVALSNDYLWKARLRNAFLLSKSSVSARLALPGPEEKGLVTATVPLATEQNAKVFINQLPLPSIGSGNKTCEPIIEQPSTPEPEHKEVSEADIEDAFWEEDPDEIPTIKLNIEELSMNVQNYMQENNMDLEDFDVSKALVALTPEAALIPVPKLKNVSRLRTEHQVYELPDSHPLLKGFINILEKNKVQLDKREPDDPSSYLLAIWTPGETAQSTQPPESCCSSQPGQLCDKETCFSCNSMREASAQTVRGTILVYPRREFNIASGKALFV